MKRCIISESGELSCRMVVVAISRGYFTTATLPETRCNKIIADVLSYSCDEKLGRRRLEPTIISWYLVQASWNCTFTKRIRNEEFVGPWEVLFTATREFTRLYIDIRTRAPFITDVNDAINTLVRATLYSTSINFFLYRYILQHILV